MEEKDKSQRGFGMFLVAHSFIWTYPKNAKVLNGRFSFLCLRNACGEPVWRWVSKILALRAAKIVWPESLDKDDSETFVVSVDGVDFKIWEKKHPLLNKDEKMCSHKFKSAGLKYEIGISVFKSDCVWLAGPFRCGKHDATIYQGKEDAADLSLRQELGLPPHKCLQDKLCPGKLAIADSIYSKGRGCAVPNQSDPKDLHNFKARGRCRQETFNGRLKCYGILQHCFCHSIQRHKIAFEAVAVTVQYSMEDGLELFQI